MVLCRSLKRPMSSSTSLASGSRVWIENGGGVTKTRKVDASSGTRWSRKQLLMTASRRYFMKHTVDHRSMN